MFFAKNDFRDKGTLSNLIQQETNRRAKRAAEIKGKKEKQKPDRKEKADEKRKREEQLRSDVELFDRFVGK